MELFSTPRGFVGLFLNIDSFLSPTVHLKFVECSERPVPKIQCLSTGQKIDGLVHCEVEEAVEHTCCKSILVAKVNKFHRKANLNMIYFHFS